MVIWARYGGRMDVALMWCLFVSSRMIFFSLCISLSCAEISVLMGGTVWWYVICPCSLLMMTWIGIALCSNPISAMDFDVSLLVNARSCDWWKNDEVIKLFNGFCVRIMMGMIGWLLGWLFALQSLL